MPLIGTVWKSNIIMVDQIIVFIIYVFMNYSGTRVMRKKNIKIRIGMNTNIKSDSQCDH